MKAESIHFICLVYGEGTGVGVKEVAQGGSVVRDVRNSHG